MLQDVFGYSSFRNGQLEASTSILAGKDVIVRMSTSGGKSLCYQLPALAMQHKCCIVICPLNSIMNDQVHLLSTKSITKKILQVSVFVKVDKLRSLNIASIKATWQPNDHHPSLTTGQVTTNIMTHTFSQTNSFLSLNLSSNQFFM